MVIAAEDPYGNLDPTVTGSVTVALAINPGGATLTGTANVQLSNGLAAFAGLSLNKSGSGYTLEASSSGLSPRRSASACRPRRSPNWWRAYRPPSPPASP